MADGVPTLRAYNPNPLAEAVANAVREWWAAQGVTEDKFGGEEAIKTLASLASNVAGICASNSDPQGPLSMFVSFAQHLIATGVPTSPGAVVAPGSASVN